jgi:hypothetical protein
MHFLLANTMTCVLTHHDEHEDIKEHNHPVCEQRGKWEGGIVL